MEHNADQARIALFGEASGEEKDDYPGGGWRPHERLHLKRVVAWFFRLKYLVGCGAMQA